MATKRSLLDNKSVESLIRSTCGVKAAELNDHPEVREMTETLIRMSHTSPEFVPAIESMISVSLRSKSSPFVADDDGGALATPSCSSSMSSSSSSSPPTSPPMSPRGGRKSSIASPLSPRRGRVASPPVSPRHRKAIHPLEWVQSLIHGANPEGAVLRVGDYTNLDPGWAEALAMWMKNYMLYPLIKRFPTSPAIEQMPNTVNLGVIGDWGTGIYGDPAKCPFVRVRDLVKRAAYEYTIHLGDVYYAGTEAEEREKFVAHWPRGALGSFTLNSNHEMYVGGKGLFDVALSDPVFASQNRTSFFAMVNDHWIVFGLDSAFNSDKKDLFMTGKINKQQKDFMTGVVHAPANRGKKVIIMSHHDPITVPGDSFNPLYDQVCQALMAPPDYWYYGHVHNAIVYNQILETRTRFRCSGHGAIPYGPTSILEKVLGNTVTWYESGNAGDSADDVRVLNGYLVLNLDGSKLTETFISELGDQRFSQSFD